MRGRSMNRMVWANGFTNDKSAYSNAEPYHKSCNSCGSQIEMRPTKKGWKPFDVNDKPHKCMQISFDN